MGGFLVMALAVPHAFEHDGLAFGLGYLFVVLLHSGMYARGTSVSEMRAILRLAPFNLVGAVLITAGGALGGTAQWVLWTGTAFMLWASPRFASVEGFVVSVAHFVERHGLVVIIAIGESVVVIGVGAHGRELDAGLVFAALLSLALSAALWWVYFSDETAVEEAFHETPAELRAPRALHAFGYWHFGILLGIVGVAAGLKKALGHPYDALETQPAIWLAAGVALFIVGDIGFRRVFALARNRLRLLAAAAALITVPLGSEVGATAQVAALAAIVIAAIVAEAAPA
jgi:low temperature requirement protein LtrA